MPDAKTARISVVWAMFIIGAFYIMTTFLGFGAATIVGSDFIKAHGGINMSAPLLAQRLAGDVFFAFISQSRSRQYWRLWRDSPSARPLPSPTISIRT